MNRYEQLCNFLVRERSHSLLELETAATWSNGVSPPRLLLAHCSSELVSVPALAKPALYNGVANMFVSQHLRHRASPMLIIAASRRWIAESLDCLGECDGSGGSTKAVG